MAWSVHGPPTASPSMVTVDPLWRITVLAITRWSLTAIASAPAIRRLFTASCRSMAVNGASTLITTPGPCTGSSPSMTRRRARSASSAGCAAGAPLRRSPSRCPASAVISFWRESLARCRSSMRKARDVLS